MSNRPATPGATTDVFEWRLGRALRHRFDHRDDSGQALVLIVIILVLLVALAPLMARQVTTDAPFYTQSMNNHAALAAAEAGIQWYRDNLDSDPNYYVYSASNNPVHDPAISGYCGAGQSSTCDLGGTNPSEAFHYVPSDANLFSQTGNEAGTVQLTVTGRAGSRGNYAYVYAEASFSTTSLLGDAYYSNYEVLDPNSQTIQGDNVGITVGGAAEPSEPETSPIVSNYLNSSNATVNVSPAESPWQLACLYDTYQVNTFVDSLGLSIDGTTYDASHPYYGPFLENSNFSFTMPSPTTVVTMPKLPCESPYDFVTGETFNGPVYTNDQLHVCGSPDFAGTPHALTSGAPSDIPYAYDVPGSIQVTADNSGTNGPYPASLIGDWVPAGYTVDTVNCNGTGDTPQLASPVVLNGQQSLPALNTSISQYGTATPPTGSGYGCIYYGPTMIELVYSTGGETMDVWSPLSANTTSACSGGSSNHFSASTPFFTGIPIPTDGVIYVENYVSSTAPTVPADGSSPCFNPYQAATTDTSVCDEGDVYLEGELQGQLTIASEANIMITRDLTYQCADGSGGASQSNPSTVSLCTSESTPDVLGLSAKYDILISGNTGNAGNTNCSTAGYGNGTGTPTNSGTVINGTSYPNDPAAVWPTVCNPQNVIIDAAIFGVQGSFGVENWSTTPQSGGAYMNGADLSEFRGPFGIVGSNGYNKEFSYDQRLAYVSPPHILPAGIPIWQQVNYVLCPNSSCPQIG